ncbi:hypothetical protein SPI_09400 [Niveomyces insectorum RCEF 264]|uniref:Uncharacterized protein n=1 Tax=Niveomyces insectorum RCEF 264 TaxID=1081102 RepID=A0A167LT56_9HYPO|nr:hypothetical protein SPI_09400 [Niveomyces insectorum RCEF 264]
MRPTPTSATFSARDDVYQENALLVGLRGYCSIGQSTRQAAADCRCPGGRRHYRVTSKEGGSFAPQPPLSPRPPRLLQRPPRPQVLRRPRSPRPPQPSFWPWRLGTPTQRQQLQQWQPQCVSYCPSGRLRASPGLGSSPRTGQATCGSFCAGSPRRRSQTNQQPRGQKTTKGWSFCLGERGRKQKMCKNSQPCVREKIHRLIRPRRKGRSPEWELWGGLFDVFFSPFPYVLLTEIHQDMPVAQRLAPRIVIGDIRGSLTSNRNGDQHGDRDHHRDGDRNHDSNAGTRELRLVTEAQAGAVPPGDLAAGASVTFSAGALAVNAAHVAAMAAAARNHEAARSTATATE